MALNWSDVDQLFSNAGYGRTHMAERVVPNLPLDIRQTDEAFWIEASVPGFRPEDVEITLDENLLTIRGIPRQEDGPLRGRYVPGLDEGLGQARVQLGSLGGPSARTESGAVGRGRLAGPVAAERCTFT